MKPEPLYRRSWQSLRAREARFDARVLRNFAEACPPEGLQIRAAEGGEATEMLLYDEVGYWGVTAKDFVLALAQVGPEKTIRLRINSPGGDVFDGLAIYNALKARKGRVACVVDGVAASAASFIACAGSSLEMAEQSMMMIHNARGCVVGDKRDMLAMAAVMAKIDSQLAGIYAAKSGKLTEAIAELMNAETWFTAKEASDMGLADAVLTGAASATARLVRQQNAHKASNNGTSVAAAARARRLRLVRLVEAEGY